MRRLLYLIAFLGCAATAGAASAGSGESLFGLDTASVTYGPYLRGEFGVASPRPGGAFWRPPGFPSDPQISFDADAGNVSLVGLAFGYDWQNGFRGELALNAFGSSDVTAPCAAASDGSGCASHADISSAAVRTRALMANVYYAPREAAGNSSRIQPFLTAGIGLARTTMSDWTRTNPLAGQPVRTFAGATGSELAWSVGAGIAIELDTDTKHPVIFEATYRYFDFGSASGGTVPVGPGASQPAAPFQFDHRSHVISVGIRIPLQRL
ncbi:outer membrane protein [Ovoidimarina sediminis]|uniref:outer membrane protein n=1 Tax=Ovoidimarina sediminis TaxID=3079856 RepID=UPI002913BE1D|nr:hypothetical protein [Rhodophyticola sp. MJ-SS7]MDU8942353.1 hypothetical protein [Rhodophyticola sp. MJ-SS7]